jgi:GNAT superfamily N-acetyltransferase
LRTQILGLQKYLWGPDGELNAAYLKWKYQDNPYLDNHLIYAALHDGQMVGMVGAYGAQWQVGNPLQTFVSPCIGDTVIHPDHRNRSLYPALMAFAIDELSGMDFPYVFDLSARIETALPLLLRGWRSLGSFDTAHWRRTQDTQPTRLKKFAKQIPLLSQVLRRLQKMTHGWSSPKGSERAHLFDHLDSHAICGSRSNVSVQDSPRSMDMAKLVQEREPDDRMQHVRDERFFSWRFQNPLCRYRFVYWDNVSGLQGYLVLQSPPWGGRGANLVDWEAKNVQVFVDLLQAVNQTSSLPALDTWFAKSSKVKPFLENIGFHFKETNGNLSCGDHRTIMMMKPLRGIKQSDHLPSDMKGFDLANWDLRMIYSDNN